ncbi:MAG: hypothetical protein PQ612_01365 [Rickettsiales bacterium]|nr:hypothetical protein [Pseudomonadota bacterium]MDA0965434.1 hypothetical protein [Pseudomonadota bacterium]MDG4542759.1 hypothetical protein [Rickettsiales bacterium]MDG4544793.1 hypothetical protein [Rickettsiales bacterium]MDG4546915.1 hypothetical protein [Rickettsiales bacterium]
MNDYGRIIGEHKEGLGKTRKIIVNLIARLERDIEIADGDCTGGHSYIWGDKDNAVSLLTKLTGLLVKVVPLEKQLLDSDKADNKTSELRVINSDDKEIIRRFLKNYKIDGN